MTKLTPLNLVLLLLLTSLILGIGAMAGYYLGFDRGFMAGTQTNSASVIKTDPMAITSFEDCIAAGYPIMESYPRRCRTDSGQSFTEAVAAPLPDSAAGSQPGMGIQPQPPTGGGMVACTMDAKLCPDGSSVGRTGPNCEFSPCPGE